MAKFDRFLKAVVHSDYGMSIRDVMETDYGHLLAILGAEEEELGQDLAAEQAVVSLGDFIRAL